MPPPDPLRSLLQGDVDHGQLSAAAILEALRLSSEGVQRVADQGADHAKLLRDIGETLHTIDKRLMLLETGGVAGEVATLKGKVAALEAAELQRKGAIGLAGWMVKNWPAVCGYIGLVVLLVEKGIIRV